MPAVTQIIVVVGEIIAGDNKKTAAFSFEIIHRRRLYAKRLL
jgi:hypothetical protein